MAFSDFPLPSSPFASTRPCGLSCPRLRPLPFAGGCIATQSQVISRVKSCAWSAIVSGAKGSASCASIGSTPF
jgi:hypothetical protein